MATKGQNLTASRRVGLCKAKKRKRGTELPFDREKFKREITNTGGRSSERTLIAKGDSLMKKLIAAAVLIATLTGTSFAQDINKGAIVFKQCRVCHSIGPGAKNKIGPELNGLDGRAAGTVPNFRYSDANRSSGIVWNEENFKRYVKYPRAFVRGTKMTFPGLKSQQQVDDLWAYVKQFDASGHIKK